MNRPLRLFVVLAACAAALAGSAPAAHAEIPNAVITEPADGYSPVFDWFGGGGPYAITVKGTTGVGAYDKEKLDIVCQRRGEALAAASGSPGLAAEDVLVSVPGGSNTQPGTFSVVIDASSPALRTPCRLRAIPAERETFFPPAQFPPGPAVYPSGLLDFKETALANPNLGARFDLDASTVTPGHTSTAHVQSFGGCGLWDARPLDPAVGPDAPALDVFSCAGFADDVADLTTPTRSELQVDGRDSFTGAMAAYTSSGLAGVAGRPTPTFTGSRDPATGLLHVTETTGVVRCQSKPPTYPFPNASDCGGFADTGLQLARDVTMSADGRSTTMHDRWTATDGAAHTLDLLLEVDMASSYGINVPWNAPGFAAYSGTAIISAPPTVPATILVASDRAVPNGDLAHPTGAVTLSTAPTGVEFVGGADPSRYMQLHYVRSVAPGAPVDLTHTFSMAPTAVESAALAARAEDSYAGPQIAITSPAGGTRTSASHIAVSGTASDNRSLAAVVVGGVPATLGPGGTWTADVPLTSGANAIVARAVDGAGNAAEATVTVTSTAVGLASGPCVVPKLKGLSSAGATVKPLRRAGCRLGRSISFYSKPKVVRKGRRLVRVTVKRFTVLGTKQKQGRRLAPGALVDLIVQGRKPTPGKKGQPVRRPAARPKLPTYVPDIPAG